MLPTLILTTIVIGLFFAGIGIRILLLKNGEFRGTCATMNPYLKKQVGNCQVCGRAPGESCGKDEMNLANIKL